ncbi:Methyltransferase domain-containing protein [Roseovarius nanhaiticus]|uniref:Methyltransferase domain-containing protein n=1 Tax=Roseovarius nanhaiticus TaxID=573024 RepID=A0A1N7FVN5_9RHOB|nr:class I SAM-dependent methyltransferase [Roseovarius nanhaiticus]SEK44130.1 Methyltransferase domain-containing protein [Roseovarius nanhaiticus]SIS04410.1 Methyltransferase domain-containing protein [Roseovarius nanhaiticus]
MSVDSETLAVYGAQAQAYADLTEGLEADKHLAAFIAAMPPGARVLDLGCGPGRAAAQMADRAFVVDAVDAVPEMVDMAAAHPGVTAWQASFDEIGGVHIYDGIWANFSLLHAPRSELPGHLATLKTALKPGGLLHIGMKTGTGEARDTLGRLYTYVTGDELRGLLKSAGLAIGPSWTGRDTGLDGTAADWIVIHAHA